MAANLRLMTIDDVVTDADLKQFLQSNKKLALALAMQFAMAAGVLRGMLREHDRRSGVRRAAKVCRPLGLAAAVMTLIAKYLAVCARRFDLEYEPEITAARGRRRTAPRTMRFGGP